MCVIYMTLFARYYNSENVLEKVSMSDMGELIKDEKYKSRIADLIYERYYNRYLKIFFFSSKEEKIYTKNSKEVKNKIFQEEYKNGFVIMASCCLLIETLASFFTGNNKTPKDESVEMFKTVFKQAEKYSNKLKIFHNESFYSKVRCGILHQGETYGKFKILRKGKLFDNKEYTINATEFCLELNKFLKSYTEELKNLETRWDSDIWDKCRIKIRHIIDNSK